MPMMDHKAIAARASLSLGYSPTLDLLMPKEKAVVQKVYSFKEDFIPFLLHPAYERKVDELTGKRTDKIVGVSQRPVYLDFSQAGFTLFISPPGAGKSFALRGLIGDLIGAGYKCVDLCSIKNGFYWSMWPIQDKFKNMLPPWRKPQTLPVVPFMPLYLKRRQNKRIPLGMKIGQIDIKDMKLEDMMTALEVDRSDAQAQLLRVVWNPENPPRDMGNLVRRINNVNSMMMRSVMRGSSLEPFSPRTKNPLIRQLTTIVNREKVFGSDYPLDIVKLLDAGYFPSLCLNGDRSMKKYHTTYMAVLARKVYDAKATKKLSGRIAFIFDDMGTLACPNQGSPSSKDVIMNDLISLGREYGIYVIGATQNLSQLPEEIIAQVRTFVFFGEISGTDLEKIAKVRKWRYGVVRQKVQEVSQYMRLPDGMRGAIVWEGGKKAVFGYVPAPCSRHGEQS